MEFAELHQRKSTGSAIGIVLTLLAGPGTGYWAYLLDPTGSGGSILQFPAFIVAGLSTIAFVGVGLIGRNESYGASLILGGVVTPVLFFLSSNLFRSVLGP